MNYQRRNFSTKALVRFSKVGFLLLMGCILMQLSSCVSYKHIPYFQDVPSDSSYVYKDGKKIHTTEVSDITIQTNDILTITIQTIDPQLNAAMTTTPATDNTTPSFLGGAGTATPNGNMTVPGYLVDKDGMVELPIAGKVKVGGLTTEAAKDLIRSKASAYYKDPIVNVQISNFKITVLGDVARPGSYLINGERATLLDAIGQAGDLTIYGVRNNVLLSRRENGQQKMVRFDLTKTDIFDSPYFYLKQGDVIYVQPGKSKAASADGTLTRTYALVSSTLALLVVLATRSY